jgi:phosphate transport system protein
MGMEKNKNMEMRSGFRKRLMGIQDEILMLGSMVADGLDKSMQSLKERDVELAKKVIADDRAINKKRFDIENKCIELIATQQPMAGDLRVIIAALNIIVELERIGDYGVGNARITIMVGDEPPLKPLVDLPRMTEKTIDMLKRSLKAYINLDAEAAKIISKEDNEIDDLYDQIYRELVLFMVSDPRTITRATRLMWVAHNLERAADRVTNICERISFLVTGKMEESEDSKY